MNALTQIFASTAGFFLLLSCSQATMLADNGAAVQASGTATATDVAQNPPQVLVNHVGFRPRGAKYCLVAGSQPVAFEIIDRATGQPVFTGHTAPGGPDLGAWQVGDFSSLSKSGTFQVRVGNGRSGLFAIQPDVYEDALRKTVAYFSKQRCGPSATGYHAPCHLDDGRRRDSGEHQDVTGGWHDACDLRKKNRMNDTSYGSSPGLVAVKALDV